MASINESIYTYIVFKQMSVCFCMVIDETPLQVLGVYF